MRFAAALLVLGAVVGAAPGARAQNEASAKAIARAVIPAVERAVGLKFKRLPVVEVRSRAQLRGYLAHKMAEELPPAELRAFERTYRAFGLIADSVDLGRLMLDLYDEQVAGYYDPDSSALFVVRGADPTVLRLIMAHELVHALQDEYMPLNSILKLRRQNDRQMAGQAVAEGQATLASIEALAPGADLTGVLGDWDTVRELIRSQRAAMPVFAAAPRIIQEGLLFPYLAGAQFMRDFDARRARPDEEPYGDRLPVSTAQILHPALYTAGHLPERIRFGRLPAQDTLVYDDDFGEFETRVALEAWGLDDDVAIAAGMGWDGDRYEVLGTPAGTALIWVIAWMTPADANEFARALVSGWEHRTGAAAGAPAASGAVGARYGTRRWRVDRLKLAGEHAVRLVDAPAEWTGWRRLPAVRASRMAR
jgi:hypothetical protein